MPVYQVELTRETAAALAYLASLREQPKGLVLAEIVTKAVAEHFRREHVPPPNGMTRPFQDRPRWRSRRRPVVYEGQDRRVNPEGLPTVTFPSYAEVWRRARPQQADWLYDRRLGHGDNGQNLLKRHEPDIFGDLRRA